MGKTYHPRNRRVHGMLVSEHPLYHKWSNMLSRCRNPKTKQYNDYGGRGICVCAEWLQFERFALDMGLPPFDGATLDRKDNDKGYCKENCRWATRTEQCLNRRRFANNTTGEVGVEQHGHRFSARYTRGGEAFTLGWHASVEDAKAYRDKFIALLDTNRVAALRMCERRVRYDSTTGIRGITPHSDGGYLVRVTNKGVRRYLGYFKTLDEAKAAKGGAA